ncbi:TIM-barrel domain-containing protein [Undibacterium sp. RuRC25W]|uniref:glycoside hydrolase family 31 protein n=1 Tax=Undibacterium sp. RuRC25W TaxID=3413047 RepID=UPI003BF2A3CD
MRKSKIHCGICHALSVSVLLLSTVSLTTAHAQNVQRVILHAEKKADRFEVTTNDGLYLFTPYSSTILETTFIPNGEKQTTSSHAVILQPQKLRTEVKTSASAIDYMAADIVVHIQKSPFQISYTYKNRLLTSEKNGYLNKGNSESVDFNLDDNEALYGAGARALGMNRRGYRLPLYNKAHYGYEEHSEQMNFGIPLVLSSRMYGIHFDNSAIGYLDLDSKKTNVLAYETISGRKTYQIIAGDSWSDVMASYTNLTGHQPLPPRWAFGNFASRFGYHTEAEARDILDKFHSDHIPVDAIIFDLYWFGKDIKGTMGNLAFDKDNFPQPQKMIADFAAQGVKTILITEPFVLTTSDKWQEAVDQHVLATDKDGAPFKYDFYFGNTGLIDIFDPRAQSWFWNIYKNLKAQGVAGWWGDLGEPEVHPSALQHKTGSADQVHNIYGHAWSKLIADGYAKEFPQERPFILMRSGYSGSQRFGMIPWSGDVNRTWGGLRSQPEIALQMGMQGMAYMHSDLGGFAGANLDDELYTRWLQYGVFQPVFRPHAQEEVASEPVLREPATKALAKAAIVLRYRMLPYNYTIAYENSQRGSPLMRPLFYAEPGNPRLYGNADSYLWGNDFLVHPILQSGQTKAEMYFPAQSKWFDFYTGQVFAAGSKQVVDVSAAHIPIFVRAGAFIPLVPAQLDIQNTSQYTGKNLELHYYHDQSVSQSQGMLYDDDGVTAHAAEQGASALLHFTSVYHGGELGVTLAIEAGAHYQATDKNIEFIVHNVDHQPQRVLVASQPIDAHWNPQTRELHVPIQWLTQNQKQLALKILM